MAWLRFSHVKCACTSGVLSASTSWEARSGPMAVKSAILIRGKIASVDAAFRYEGSPGLVMSKPTLIGLRFKIERGWASRNSPTKVDVKASVSLSPYVKEHSSLFH